MSADACVWCGEPAVAYCDGWLGCERVTDSSGAESVVRADGAPCDAWTCDAPICNEHRAITGNVCGRTADTIDFCPAHVGRVTDFDSESMTAEQADALRREMWAIGYRHRFCEVAPSAAKGVSSDILAEALRARGWTCAPPPDAPGEPGDDTDD